MAPKLFFFDDYIARAGSPEAGASLLLAELRQAPEACRKEVAFSAGREYHFFAEHAQGFHWHISNHEQAVIQRCAILLEGLRNVTLRGHGARLLMHGCLVPLAIVSCQEVTVEELSIDYPVPSVHQLSILETNAEADEMLCEVCGETPFRIEDNQFVFEAEGREFRPYWAMPFEASRHLIYQCADHPLYQPKQPTLEHIHEERAGARPSRHVRIVHPNRLFRPGQRLVLRDAHRPAPGCFMYLCNSLEFNKICIYFSDGMGFLVQRCEEVTLKQCACTPSPAQPWRYFSCQADATHFVGCRGVVRVEDSLFEQMGDDAINVHGVYLSNIIRKDDHTLVASYCHRESWGHRWGEPGDRIRLVRSDTLEDLSGEWTIQAIEPVDAYSGDGAKTWRITTAEPLPELDASKRWGVENVSWTPEVVFRRNLVRNNRARGALFTTRGEVRCEGNCFDHVHGTAILVCGDCTGWFESGTCGKVTVTDNDFIDDLTADYEFCEAVVSVAPHIAASVESGTPVHGVIEVIKNRFVAFDAPLLYAHSARKVVFRENAVVPSDAYLPWHPNRRPVSLLGVAENEVEN